MSCWQFITRICSLPVPELACMFVPLLFGFVSRTCMCVRAIYQQLATCTCTPQPGTITTPAKDPLAALSPATSCHPRAHTPPHAPQGGYVDNNRAPLTPAFRRPPPQRRAERAPPVGGPSGACACTFRVIGFESMRTCVRACIRVCVADCCFWVGWVGPCGTPTAGDIGSSHDEDGLTG